MKATFCVVRPAPYVFHVKHITACVSLPLQRHQIHRPWGNFVLFWGR